MEKSSITCIVYEFCNLNLLKSVNSHLWFLLRSDGFELDWDMGDLENANQSQLLFLKTKVCPASYPPILNVKLQPKVVNKIPQYTLLPPNYIPYMKLYNYLQILSYQDLLIISNKFLFIY